MSETINIDFSSVSEVIANGVNLTAIYVTTVSLTTGEKNTVLVWPQDTAPVTFSLYYQNGTSVHYTRTVANGTNWATYTESNPDFGVATDDPSEVNNAYVIFLYITSSYFVMRDDEYVKGGDIIMNGKYSLKPRT